MFIEFIYYLDNFGRGKKCILNKQFSLIFIPFPKINLFINFNYIYLYVICYSRKKFTICIKFRQWQLLRESIVYWRAKLYSNFTVILCCLPLLMGYCYFSRSDRNSSRKLGGKGYRRATFISCKPSRSSSTSERSSLGFPWCLFMMRSLTSSNKLSISSREDQAHLWLSLSTYSGGKVNLAEGNLEGSGLSSCPFFGRRSLCGTLEGCVYKSTVSKFSHASSREVYGT